MKRIGLKALLYFLRSLIYVKRALVVIINKFIKLLSKVYTLYSKTVGFYLYKGFFIIKKRLFKRLNISKNVRFIDFFGQRWALQIVIFVIAVVVMVPHSKLYTKTTEKIHGQNTLLYVLVGPGDQNFGVEEFEIDLKQLPQKEVRTWREGSVVLDTTGVAGIGSTLETQEIAGVSAGGSAVNKPIILPGSELPTISPSGQKRSEIIYHVVQPGEVVGKIAQDYGLNVLTVLWANDLTSRSYIRPGDKLAILPTNGVLHKVVSGDNLSKIAKLYDAKVDDIVKFNKLQEGGADIVVGERLIIPDGSKPQPVYTSSYSLSFSSIAAPPPSITAPAGSRYIWPTSVKRITQYYGWRHTGLDIAGPVGTPLYAARAGTVIRSQCGWNGGYGCYVIIDHGGGVTTLYGHASKLYVDVGEDVVQGQTIAAMGSTGQSTGPHIHFEVRVGGARNNPLQYIR
ncbi:MAG: hypothetical protein A2725_02460 [Candidatus Magasanikbacteria bacterium RIFCSPHIGHO2_01_FULL_33_34]|uniref:LysM domain-containing protein n=1 Tax=Candidatus Magasanikbacteria bacterium RIFCSPHIGHO2_01_FULL_33_34 TaxID=1798671 RepID=A0A1F6LKK0_9BACT|nr:MAG: hypothetical protein A2725_02460 [Candidatus Magasanikbacteria bacterium RIFCSPHIGHO2_01_FULL_33_34]OGH65616.1 MAG: hypothetical protein A3B83_01940 [Candidatus Magasanikbacteria bacterium RIFCSPHIGHO2_02_FULL_33_17]OGH75825.1 MAG: hypothetical protein A3A89_02835 [Candidatus Magasanikbacteria bacterium RIFCSPLOWO2_01_FULL_33_34]OGH81312.1 MAG: hypothetical protein A3F93_03825 [Candidatus Magasanikbacteria bacterium RIFCSPLOWO2_12_FULL_34_7]